LLGGFKKIGFMHQEKGALIHLDFEGARGDLMENLKKSRSFPIVIAKKKPFLALERFQKLSGKGGDIIPEVNPTFNLPVF
jgi:hypothetical protein